MPKKKTARKTAKKKTIRKVSPLKGRKHKKWGVVPKHERRVAGAGLGKVSAATLKSELKGRVKDTLSKQLLKRELATTKRDRKKISKQITATKSELRRLN